MNISIRTSISISISMSMSMSIGRINFLWTINSQQSTGKLQFTSLTSYYLGYSYFISQNWKESFRVLTEWVPFIFQKTLKGFRPVKKPKLYWVSLGDKHTCSFLIYNQNTCKSNQANWIELNWMQLNAIWFCLSNSWPINQNAHHDHHELIIRCN